MESVRILVLAPVAPTLLLVIALLTLNKRRKTESCNSLLKVLFFIQQKERRSDLGAVIHHRVPDRVVHNPGIYAGNRC